MQQPGLGITPPKCPQHPDLQLHRIEDRYSKPKAHHLQQFHCAAGCDTALCWVLHGPEGLVATGNGRCDDPRVEQAFATDDYEDQTATMFGGLLAGALMMGVLTAVIALASASAAEAACALMPGTAALGCAAGIYPYIRHRRRQQPERPDFSQPT